MEQLSVGMGEWFFTQGLIGYKTILENYGVKVKTTYDGIIVEKQHLEIMADAFFDYYLKVYSVASREERYLRRLHHQFKNGETTVKKDLNQRINETKKKVEKYFSDTEEGLQFIEAANRYRQEKKYDEKLDPLLDQLIESLSTKQIDEKLTANFFKTTILRSYFGQVSFLNVSKNALTLEEQKAVFYKDFIEPVLVEWALMDAIEKEDAEEVHKVLNGTNHKIFNSIKSAFKKKTVKEMKDFIQQKVHHCTFTEFPIALHSFEEGIFTPLALSLKNVNVTWEAQKTFLPLCSLARLLIFCSQAGATRSQNKSVFIYYGGTFDALYQTNQFYADMKNPNKTFDEIVFNLVREQKLKADYLTKNHYMIFEFTSDYDSKKTILDYMVMTPFLMKLFSEHGDLFQQIHPINRGTFIKYLLQNIDPKHFILNVLRNKIKKGYSALEVIRMIQIRHLNLLLAKGEEKVESAQQKRYVWALVKSAEEVRRKIGDKKAQGIAYRLLNAVRSHNKNTFMDTVMRTYISCDLQMPGILLEALHEEKMDFATVGNAWIAGLVSKPNEIKEGEKTDE